jgi:hypothetical protein
MLTLQLLLSVGTPLVLKFGLYRDATFIDWKESGTSMATSLLFLVIFVIQGFSGAVGLLAVCMQRTGSLVLAILMQIGTAATTVTALACSVVYIEVSHAGIRCMCIGIRCMCGAHPLPEPKPEPEPEREPAVSPCPPQLVCRLLTLTPTPTRTRTRTRTLTRSCASCSLSRRA